MESLTLWTIGHSNRSIEDFIALLQSERIEILVDVRQFPSSRTCPQFGEEALRKSLAEAGLGYQHLVELGGRRRARPDSHNVAWRNDSFRGYADYMETPAFADGVERLVTIARERRAAIMCSEAVWWRCHRSLIADYLKVRGAQVRHILSLTKVQKHPYTSAARIIDGRLSYEGVFGE
jgi:uncharacterized protein (DUF488 family)